MIRIILHLSVLVIIQPSSKSFNVFSLFFCRILLKFQENYIPVFISGFYSRTHFIVSDQLYLMDNGRPSLDNIGYRLFGALLL